MMISPENVYELLIFSALITALVNLAIVLGYRYRVSPWHAKFVFAIGLVVGHGWLYFRVWESISRSWIGVLCLFIYLASFVYYVLAYRRSPLRMKDFERDS